MNPKQYLPQTEYGWILVTAAVLALLPLLHLESTFWLRTYGRMLILALIAIGLNIAFGHTDQLFLFMGGVAGIAAYTTALLSQEVLGVTPWVMIPVGVFAAASLGALVSWISAKRKLGIILISILTLNLQLALEETFVGARSITGGSEGYNFEGLNLGFSGVGGLLGVNRFVVVYYLILAFIVGALFVYVWMMQGKYGLAFEAIREDDLAASSVGIDVVRYKTIAGFVGAGIIGLAGIMTAEFQGVVLPGDYTFARIDVLVLIILIIGGLRTTFGPILGAAVVIGLEETLGFAVQWESALFGGLLIVLFLYFRQGLMPFASDLRDRFIGPAPTEPAPAKSETTESETAESETTESETIES
ncbi:MAG: branched-chain amino acid ABC transporter permease [Halobacteriota archaeon]